jgi:hypothetical protein
MRALMYILPAFLLAHVGLAQQTFPKSPDDVRIRRLTIESTSLPDADRDRVTHLFENSHLR